MPLLSNSRIGYSRLETIDGDDVPSGFYQRNLQLYRRRPVVIGVVIGALTLLALFFFGHGPRVKGFDPGFPYGKEKVRGVNLGGWLVLEPWITPSLFDETGNPNIVDEWTFGEMQPHEKALDALTAHWDTWITEEDFKEISAAGLNHVRLPIGYWAFEVGNDEPYIQGQLPYLFKAIEWAGKYGLKVIVDLHGAPGSQNGFDNSGRKMDSPTWHLNATNVARTNDVVKTIAAMFKNDTRVVTAIAPLNEPAGFYGLEMLAVTRQFWKDSYASIRKDNSNQLVLLHDAFIHLSHWQGLTRLGWKGVAMDTHIYQMFTVDQNRMSEVQHIALTCSHGHFLSTFEWPVIVGEWCPAMTDCARHLNGRGVGSRYEGTHPDSKTRIGTCETKTGHPSKFSEEYKISLRKYWEAQVGTYEKGAGWIQWTWKVEEDAGSEWAYRSGLEYGWIPKDVTERKHPAVCKL